MVTAFGLGDWIRRDPLLFLRRMGVYRIVQSGADIIWTFPLEDFIGMTKADDPAREAGYAHEFFDISDLPQWFHDEVMNVAAAQMDVPVESLADTEIAHTEVYKKLMKMWDDVFNEEYGNFVWQEFQDAIGMFSEGPFRLDAITDEDNEVTEVTVTMPKKHLLNAWKGLLEEMDGPAGESAVREFIRGIECVDNFYFNSFDLGERWSNMMDEGYFEAGVERVAERFHKEYPDFQGPVDDPNQMFLPFEES